MTSTKHPLPEQRTWLHEPVWDRWASLARFDLVIAGLFLSYQAVVACAFAEIEGPTGSVRAQWDARAYIIIASEGYPRGGSPGAPPEGFGIYAFHPLYPMVVRLVAAATGLEPGQVSPWLSLGAATLGVIALSMWLRPRVGRAAILGAVLALLVWPASPVLQMGYTEGLALLLLVLAWRLVTEKRVAAACTVLVALSLTRQILPVLVAVIVFESYLSWRRREPGSLRRLAIMAGTVLAAVGLWPALAGLLSGDPNVYWSAHLEFAVPGGPTSPAELGMHHAEVGVLLLLVLAMTSIVAFRLMPMTTPSVVRSWVALYPPYIALSALVTPSLIRYMLFSFPMGLALGPCLQRRVLWPVLTVVMIAAGLLGAWWWVGEFVPLGPDRTYP